MIKSHITIFFILTLLSSLAGCENNKNKSISDAIMSDRPSDQTVGTLSKEEDNLVTNFTQSDMQSVYSGGIFNPDSFASKIKRGFYANGNHLLVLSNQLHLYNTETDEIISSISLEQSEFTVKSFDNGYLTIGFENNELSCNLYDETLQKIQYVMLSNLITDYFISPDAIAISPNGKQIAFAGIKGLYIYDIESESTNTLLNFESDTAINGNRITLINHLAFAADSESIIYAGLGNTIPMIDGEESFSIYGAISVDGNTKKIIKKDSYEIESLYVYGDTLVLPQSFEKSDGTLLIADTAVTRERMIHFNGDREGKDGVFCSSQGEYIATATLGEGMTIRIYSTSNGQLVHTEFIPDNGEEYFYRVPQVLLLDGSRTCIVLMGQSIDDTETLTTVFEF